MPPTVVVLQAADIAGVTWTSPDRLAALIPVALTDGRAIVGLNVLTDPVHARSKTLLQARSQVDYATLSAVIPAGLAIADAGVK